MSFRSDLERGRANEERFAEWLKSQGFTGIKFCEWKGYDVMAEIDGKVRTFEVKTDFADTPNIAIEFLCLRRGETSGIMSTHSDYWVQFDGYGDAMMWRTKALREFIAEKKPPMVYGGDDKLALMFLVRKDELPPFREVAFETGNGYF